MHMLTSILAIAFLTAVPDIVIWNCVLATAAPAWKWLALLPTAAVLCLMAAAKTELKIRNRYLRLFIGSLLFLAIPKLLFAAVAWPLGWRAGAVAATATVLVFAHACAYGWRRLVVKRRTFEFKDLPKGFDGYRILQVSDLHAGSFEGHPEMVGRIVSTANSLDADLVVFTGDLINLCADEALPFARQLAGLKAKDGVLSIFGNHDYTDTMRVQEAEEAMGWRMLNNAHADIHRGRDVLYVLGVEYVGKLPFYSRGNLREALAGVPDGAFKVLLTHDPSHWQLEALGKDIQLTLSGHTHGGQLKIGRLSPARLIYKEWGGTYTREGKVLHVSMGVGGRIRFRLGAWPEINLLTLKAKA